MHLLLLLLFGSISAFWLTYGLRTVRSVRRLPRLRDYEAAADKNCPSVSLLFAARDEEEKLRDGLETLLALDYPQLEIIAVDDRSTDATPHILQEFAAKDSRLKIVRVNELPKGWLGKPHALQKGYEASTGEWLVFTDADVQFERETLRRSVTLVLERSLDHLTLMCRLLMEGFWEKTVLTFFGMGLFLIADASGLEDPRSKAYAGVGAFQMVKRKAYEASGTHRGLALEVVDDMRLARNLKAAGFRSNMGLATDFVQVRWHAGVKNIVRGVTKNFFAAADYSLGKVALQSAALLGASVLPFVGAVLLRGPAQSLAMVGAIAAVALEAGVAILTETSPWYALLHPVGALLFVYMLLRSTAVTLWQGGVTWRDTFYSLEELKGGAARAS